MAAHVAEVRDALKGTKAADNEDVIAAFADGWSAAESQSGARRRGGAPKKVPKEDPPPPPADPAAPAPPPSIPAAARQAVANTAEFAGQVGRAGAGAAANAILAAPLVLAAGGGGALALNNPTMFGNIAGIVSNILATGSESVILSTWGDWGQAVLEVGNAVGVLGQSAVAQSIRGPIVPFTIAAAALAYASRNRPDGPVGLIGSMLVFVKNKLPKVLPARPRTDDASTLRELAEIAKANGPRGAGADAIAATVRALGAPAVRGGPAGVETVAAAAERDLKAALDRIARRPVGVDTGARSRAASVRAGEEAAAAAAAEAAAARARGAAGSGEIGDRDQVMAAPAAPAALPPAPMGRQLGKRGREDEEEDTGAGTGMKKARSLGGRRKTKKSKTKRRVTRRKAPAPIKFVY